MADANLHSNAGLGAQRFVQCLFNRTAQPLKSQ